MASSKDLGKWTIKHLLSPEEFNGLSWNAPAANGKMKVTPLISDVIYFNNQFYSFAYGDDADEKTYISVLTSPSLDGPYTIQKDPILSPNPKSKFSNHDVYFPKVVRFKDSWLMYYTAKNESKEEFICLAQSSDLKTWKTVKENIIPRNNGWNSGLSNQLCAQVKIKDNQIHIWATGIKDVGDYSQPNKGNAMDECIGEFYSSTPGSGFIEAPGNPIFGGNPTFDFENDHIGGAFQELIHEGYKYTFYHGKGRTSKNYTILVK